MVHHRLNERETHPNKHINFICPLRMPDVPPPFSEEDARQLLRALAAQVRPIMKNHGFEVNSFEEYEYNRVFAGRNWEAGEVIELVLRNADGTFVSIPWLMSTLCHELAHIKHMNHGPDFQRLWAQLRREVKALQDKGYYGDGYWSSGTRLSDSATVVGQGVADVELPEYICGGAQRRARPKATKRRRPHVNSEAGPSRKRRGPKPGARVRAKGKFKGEGRALNADISDEEEKKKGTGFRKQAGSNRARDERAKAVEKRLRVLQGMSTKEELSQDSSSDTGEESDDDDLIPETDENRLKTMRESMKDNDELNSMRKFMKDFLIENSMTNSRKEKKKESTTSTRLRATEDFSEDDNIGACSLPSTSNPVASNDHNLLPTSRLLSAEKEQSASRYTCRQQMRGSKANEPKSTSTSLMTARKETSTETAESPWTCLVCTLENLPMHLSCDACASERGTRL